MTGPSSAAERRALRDGLAAVPARLAAAATSAAGRPRAPGEWSAAEVVRHLLTVEEDVWLQRLRQVTHETRPRWPWIEPGLGRPRRGRALAWLLDAYTARRGETVRYLDGLDAAGWMRSGIHATYGVLDVAGLLRRALAHDEEHLADLERRAAGGRAASR